MATDICNECKGTGRCPMCQGVGSFESSEKAAEPRRPCHKCHCIGECQECHGKGKRARAKTVSMADRGARAG